MGHFKLPRFQMAGLSAVASGLIRFAVAANQAFQRLISQIFEKQFQKLNQPTNCHQSTYVSFNLV